MVNQAIEREINATAIVRRSGLSGRGLATLVLGLVVALAVASAVIPRIADNTTDAALSVQRADTATRAEADRWTALAASYADDIRTPGQLAEMARWKALVVAEYPGAVAGVRAEAERWTALAAAYAGHDILTPGQMAEAARWEALAGRYTRAHMAEAARWNGLANHHQTHAPALQAWADRYQGLADASE